MLWSHGAAHEYSEKLASCIGQSAACTYVHVYMYMLYMWNLKVIYTMYMYIHVHVHACIRVYIHMHATHIQGYRKGYTYPRYMFFTIPWYVRDRWWMFEPDSYGCTVEERETVLEYSLILMNLPFAIFLNMTTETDTGYGLVRGVCMCGVGWGGGGGCLGV